MKRTTADYIDQTKRVLGNRGMSDREFGEVMPVAARGRQATPYAQQTIAKAKHGNMSDPLALDIAAVLKSHGVDVDAGEILLIARAEREKDERVKRALLDYAKKVLASVPSKVASAIGALAVALGMLLPAHDAQAIGGAGRFRPRP